MIKAKAHRDRATGSPRSRVTRRGKATEGGIQGRGNWDIFGWDWEFKKRLGGV